MSLRQSLPLLVVVLCLAYAAVRYTIFGDVSPEQLPLYVVNKAVSLAGLILLGWSRCAGDRSKRRQLGTAGFGLIVVHVLISLAILNPAYYTKFFHPSGMMTWQIELSMLAGVVGVLALCLLFFIPTDSDNRLLAPTATRRLLGRGVLALAALHVLLMGYAGWLTPSKWYGYLPPITLLSFVVAIGAIFWRRK